MNESLLVRIMNKPLTIGIVGGMSPESTVTYYQHLVRRHQNEFGDHNYPRILIASVSFQKYVDWQHEGSWGRIADELIEEFRSLAAAGADFAILATNTMHKVLPQILAPIPILSILDAVADHAHAYHINRVGLTGTLFTMSDGFYVRGLEDRGLSVVLPLKDEQEAIHNTIYGELISGKILPKSISKFTEISESLLARGAEKILLGCTELELLTREFGSLVNFLDSTKIHADAAWEVCVGMKSLTSFGNVNG